MHSMHRVAALVVVAACALVIAADSAAAPAAGADGAGVSPAVRRSWQKDFEELRNALADRDRATASDGADAHLLDAHAGFLPADRDPLDVELRRASALLAYLEAMAGAPDLSGPASRLRAIRRDAESLDPSVEAEARKGLYMKARAARRQAALANPLLDFDEILLTTGRPGGAHIQSHFYGRHYGNGRLLAVTGFRTRDPKARELLGGVKVRGGRLDGQELKAGRFYTLDLSCDGTQLLFEWCARKLPKDPGPDSIFNPSHMTPDNTYNVFRVNLGTMDLVQLTDTMYNDSCPAWLPDGRVVFISDRRGTYVRCHPHGPPQKPFAKRGHHQPCATLHTMKADGSDVIPISWHETSETFPRVANDGRIVYTRWDYIDREFHAGHHIWFCTPDGRDPRAPHGNYPMPHSMMETYDAAGNPQRPPYHEGRSLRPWAEYGIRPIPGSRRFIAVASVHHSSPKGQLVVIDPSVPDDSCMSQVRQVHPGHLPNEGWKADSRSMAYPYAWPWPLSEDFYMASHLDDGGALVLLDRFGNRDVLYAGAQVLFAIPRRRRPRPPVIPVETYQGERAGRPGHTRATIAVMNVYDADFDWPEGTRITRLRVVQLFPRPWSSPFNNVGESYMNGTTNRMTLGTVPVEADGSVYFEAPVSCEIYFQALDASGFAVQSMRSGTYVHPGEHLTCGGCHEDKWHANLPGPRTPLALQRPPSKLEPEAGGVEPASFYRLVQPVFKAKCLPCHQREEKGLRTAEYRPLEAYAFYFHGSGGGSAPNHGGYRSTAGRFGARASRLGQTLLAARHQAYLEQGTFSRDDLRRICLWLDLNSMQYGSSSIDPKDQAAQRAGRIVWPKIDLDPTNPQRVERDRPPRTCATAAGSAAKQRLAGAADAAPADP